MSDLDIDKPLDARLRRRWAQRMHSWRIRWARDRGGDEPQPEDFLPTPKVPPSGFELFPQPGAAWVANGFLVAMVVCCVLHWTWKGPGMSPFMASHASVFGAGEYWRLVTALGGHGDLMHFLHNAPIFWFFAWLLNGYFGWVAALLGALVIGVLSNAVTIWFYDPHMRLLGASGMVYGLVALWLTLYIRFDLKGWWVKRVIRSFGFSMLVLFPQTYEANVSYLAHASGFVLGILAGFAFMPFVNTLAPVKVDPYYLGSGRI